MAVGLGAAGWVRVPRLASVISSQTDSRAGCSIAFQITYSTVSKNHHRSTGYSSRMKFLLAFISDDARRRFNRIRVIVNWWIRCGWRIPKIFRPFVVAQPGRRSRCHEICYAASLVQIIRTGWKLCRKSRAGTNYRKEDGRLRA